MSRDQGREPSSDHGGAELEFSHPLTRRSVLGAATMAGIGAAFGISASTASAAQTGKKADHWPRWPIRRNDLVMLPALTLSDLIRRGRVSCVEVMQAYLEHIHRYNPEVNAIINLIDDNTALAAAAEKDRLLRRGEYQGWMHGFPQAPKLLQSVAGFPDDSGSPVFEGQIATEDSRLVTLVREAGAIIIGQTNSPEFGLGSSTYNPIYGRTGSAFAPDRTSGGSSGGAASSLALRMLPVADGSDYMGSLRNPAAFNNVLGYRPSFGRISSGGFIVQAGASGPMARNVEDLAALLVTFSGPTGRNPLELREDPAYLGGSLKRDFTGTRIAWVGDFDGYLATEPGVLAVCESSFPIFESIGAKVEAARPEFEMAELWEAWLIWRGLAQLSRHDLWSNPETRALMKPEAVWEVEQAVNYDALDVRRADSLRNQWYAAVMDLFETYDYILAPSAQVFPFDIETNWPSEIDGRPMDTYHRWMETVAPWSLTQLPNMGMPAGFSSDGLPMGIQLIGQRADDLSVLQMAYAYEQAAGLNEVLPPLLET
jgi:Asp-tRNA(Asn)/Glu-tRNA(Gln) amidotransferase A subunit family amidase